MALKRIKMSAKGYLGGEFLTTILDKIAWTNSEFKIRRLKMALSPLFNVGDVSRRFSELSTLIEWGRGGGNDAQQIKISEKMTLSLNLCP